MCLENLCEKSDILLRERTFYSYKQAFFVRHRSTGYTCMHVSMWEVCPCVMYAYTLIIFPTSLRETEMSFEHFFGLLAFKNSE